MPEAQPLAAVPGRIPPGERCVAALDLGTTSTRACLLRADGELLAVASRPLPLDCPQDGWVEQDAAAMARDAAAVLREVLATAGLGAAEVRAGAVAAVGLANQRETVVLWERASGRPLHAAIVWQDRRTADRCAQLAAAGHEALISARTGLLLDPYFSATKLAWLLDHVPGARARAAAGELCAGTVDTWILWSLTGGARHVTDATNASRTALFDIHRQCWDAELLALFDVPATILPEVQDSIADFGTTRPELCGVPLALRAVLGDQQAATLGQACLAPGDIKCTYGTGGFLVAVTGERPLASRQRLLTTPAWRLDGAVTYALEGSFFAAGSTIQWLRDGLGLFADSAQSEALARRADPRRRVHLVPAFTGLGAPWWDPGARGAILGLGRDATAADVTLAALQSVGFQTADLLDALLRDGVPRPAALRVDGGLARNDLAMQFVADICAVPVERPAQTETTVLGAALAAALGAGLHADLRAATAGWRLERRFEPTLGQAERSERLAGWHAAVARVRSGS